MRKQAAAKAGSRCPPEVIAQVHRLARRNPKTGEKRSLQQIADELAKLGYVGPSGKVYFPIREAPRETASRIKPP